uniref:Uncharacterized protein n=1 Tax=viral metagenome TaxID=1070528 RepID=A0A2V0RMP5_9ZZZZ
MDHNQPPIAVFIIVPILAPVRWVASRLGPTGALLAAIVKDHGDRGKAVLSFVSEQGYYIFSATRFYSICSGCFFVGSVISYLFVPSSKLRKASEAKRLYSAISQSSLTGRDSSEVLLESLSNLGISPDVANLISWLVVNSKALTFIIPLVKLTVLIGISYFAMRWLLFHNARKQANSRNYFSGSQDELEYFNSPTPQSRYLR